MASAIPADTGNGTPAIWQRLSGPLAAKGPGKQVETRPSRFRAYALDRVALRELLADAPLENSRAARRPLPVVSIAGPDGVERFEVVESPVMEPGMAKLYPTMKTYAGRGLDDPRSTVRFDITPLGFHASVRGPRGSWYVDPYFKNDQSAYVSYYGRDLEDEHGPHSLKPPLDPDGDGDRRSAPAQRAGEIVTQRVYRLALISDPTYASYFGANVDAAKVVLMNRVNQVYNDDLAIKLVLVADTPKLNLDTAAKYSGPAGPCVAPCYPPGTGNGCDTQTIIQNNFVAGAIVGPINYDIGHLALGKAGGGVAYLGVVGDPVRKAGGCTGVPTPTGDYFAVDYVAHEMGHQFGGNHTFNGTQSNCSGGNRSGSTAVEPGSGSSVMAYAGICGQDNLQPHSDPYFSQRSIDEIQTYVGTADPGSTNQGTPVTTANHSPVVTAPPTQTVPIRTPFTLTGGATDADGDPLIFMWEQNDVPGGGGTALTSNTKASGPLFRIFSRSAQVTAADTLLSPSPGQNLATAADATRSFPDTVQVAAGNTNAAAGTCPTAGTPIDPGVLDCYSEFLPTSSRTLNFRLTARDQFTSGAGVTHADAVVTVAGSAPFRVTSQTGPEFVNGDTSVPVTWDVAGTAAAPFSAADVQISYSTDGGQTFPSVLATSTPNDGATDVVVPNIATSKGRFKVTPVSGGFFDISRGELTVTEIGGTPSPTATATETPTETATETPTETPTETATRSPPITETPTPTPTETATATAVAADTPTAVATPGPVATPSPTTDAGPPTPAIVRPWLRNVRRHLRPSRKRRVALRIGCLPVSGAQQTARCRGTVRLYARNGKRLKRVGTRRITIASGAAKTYRVRLSRGVWRKLRRTSQLGVVRVTVANPGSRSLRAAKKVRILRRR